MTRHGRALRAIGFGALLLTGVGCSAFREVAPPPGTALRSIERERQSVRRELEFGGTRPVDWISGGERWARDIAALLEELRWTSGDGSWRLGVTPTINESGLPAASFLALHHQLMRAMRAAGVRNQLTVEVLTDRHEAGSPRFDAIVVPRILGDVRSGERFTLAYELRRAAPPK